MRLCAMPSTFARIKMNLHPLISGALKFDKFGLQPSDQIDFGLYINGTENDGQPAY